MIVCPVLIHVPLRLIRPVFRAESVRGMVLVVVVAEREPIRPADLPNAIKTHRRNVPSRNGFSNRLELSMMTD